MDLNPKLVDQRKNQKTRPKQNKKPKIQLAGEKLTQPIPKGWAGWARGPDQGVFLN